MPVGLGLNEHCTLSRKQRRFSSYPSECTVPVRQIETCIYYFRIHHRSCSTLTFLLCVWIAVGLMLKNFLYQQTETFLAKKMKTLGWWQTYFFKSCSNFRFLLSVWPALGMIQMMQRQIRLPPHSLQIGQLSPFISLVNKQYNNITSDTKLWCYWWPMDTGWKQNFCSIPVSIAPRYTPPP